MLPHGQQKVKFLANRLLRIDSPCYYNNQYKPVVGQILLIKIDSLGLFTDKD